MGLFSKINYNEYNNKLEKILEEKDFNIDTKNLLLSMLYKVENGYKDYYKVKKYAKEKDFFIKKILKIVKEYCYDINTVTPKTVYSKELEKINSSSKIDINNGSILVYANEKDLLKSLIEINLLEEEYKYNNENRLKALNVKYYEKAIKEFIFKAIPLNEVEVIRDFDGWSWNNSFSKVTDIDINLIFQLILILKINYKKVDFYNKKYEDAINENEESFDKWMYIMILTIISEQNIETKNEILNRFKYLSNLLELMKNKREFLENIDEKKKQIYNDIKNIDEIINNKYKLRDEYDRRNSKLKNKDKIFSPSFLIDILKKERNDKLNKIKELNSFLDPLNFVENKDKYNNEKSMLEIVINNNENKNNKRESIINLQKYFLEMLNKQINKNSNNKDYLEKIIFVFRYYLLMPISIKEKIKDINEIEDKKVAVINNIIDNSINNGIITDFSNSTSLCYNILKYIFISNIIDLKEIQIKITKIKKEKFTNEIIYTIGINIYDLADKEESYIENVDNLNLINVKLNKKNMLFLR